MLYKILFPRLESKDLKRFFTTASAFILISTSYAMFRRIKDVIIANTITFELISPIKMFVVMPVSILSVILYQKILSSLSDKQRDNILYNLSIFFFVYCIIYGLSLLFFGYSGFSKVSPRFTWGQNMNNVMGLWLVQFATLANNFWHVSFYLAAELYGTLVLSFSFWAYLNRYFSIEEAKVFYPYILASASLSNIISGILGSAINLLVFATGTRFHEIYNAYSILVIAFMILASLVFYNMSVNVNRSLKSEDFVPKKSKAKMSILTAIRNVMVDRVIFCMLICVVIYMASINLVEVTWKKMTANYYLNTLQDKCAYNNFMSMIQLLTGVFTILCSYLSQLLYYRFGWLSVAMLTPIMLSSTGLMFFGSALQMIPFALPHIIGGVQNVSSKSLKYSAFDFTKETSFIYLDKDTRERGKAVVDVLGGRIGKSIGGLIQMVLMSALVSPNQLHVGQEIIAPYIASILFVLSIVWVFAVIAIYGKLKHIMNNRDAEINNNNRQSSQKQDSQTSENESNTPNKKFKDSKNTNKEDDSKTS